MSGVWTLVPGLGPIRTSTVAAALLILVSVGLWKRRPWLAVVALMAWVSAYELIFNAVGISIFHWTLGQFLWYGAAVIAWVFLAYREGIRPDRFWLLIFFACWIPWLLEGFHSNIPVGRPWDTWGEIWNEIGKTALAFAYLFGALRLLTKQDELMKELVVRDDRSGIRRNLQLDRVGVWLNRTFG